MNYEEILAQIARFDNDELLYRHFYHTKDAPIPREALSALYPEETNALEIVFDPQSIPFYRPEEEFFTSERNTAVIKHPRYLPLFYHEHAFFELIYVLSGTCVQSFQRSAKTPSALSYTHKLTLKQGDLCMIAPREPHGIEVFDDGSLVLNILIKRSTFLDIFLNAVRDKNQLSLFFLDNLYTKKSLQYLLYHTGEDLVIRNYILDMYGEQLHFDEYSDRIMCSILTIFLAQLTRRHKNALETPKVSSADQETKNKLFDYMLNHYQTVTLSQLAKEFHFSVPYCSRLIKSLTGSTFSELLNRIRLQQGENLLLLTPLSAASISEKLGYENPETFIRAFKRHYGVTPGQYRKKS